MVKKYNIEWDRVLVCMEFTGIYNRPMLQFCTLKKIAVWMIMPIEIIRSMGIQRGKNDKIDSKKIAMYAILHHDKIKVWQPVSKNIVLLKDLLALRQRLIKVSKILLQPINELKAIKDKVAAKETEVHCKSSIEQLKKELHKTEARIKRL
ncbi:MAG: transposase [Bacteroidetes bacterium]|nr:transposase [Bacteroidota bacterium]